MRPKKLFSATLVALSLGWFAVGEYPQLVFGSPRIVGRFSIYGQTGRPEQMRRVLENSERLVQKYEGTLPSSIRVIMSTPFVYSIVNPMARNAFAVTRGIGNVVWIRDGTFADDLSFSGHDKNNRHSLSGTIAHETIHVALNADPRGIKSSSLPSWLEEGYCDYVANETSYPFDEGVSRLLTDSSKTDVSFQYFQYYAAVRYLIETEKKSFVEIVRRAADLNYHDLAMQFARRASTNNDSKYDQEADTNVKSQ